MWQVIFFISFWIPELEAFSVFIFKIGAICDHHDRDCLIIHEYVPIRIDDDVEDEDTHSNNNHNPVIQFRTAFSPFSIQQE